MRTISRLLVIVALAVILAASAGLYVGLAIGKPKIEIIQAPQVQGERVAVMNLPAVDESGRGVIATLTTRIRPGSGLVLVSINDLVVGGETQLSARRAAEEAAKFTNSDLNNTDVIYTIKANASLVEGPSAGAAMAVSTIAALQGKPLRNDVMITGTIERGGTIGPVGAVLEKARASRDVGAILFLVAKGQGSRVLAYEEHETCQQFGSITICQTFYQPRSVQVGEELGITITEVADIGEAARFMIAEVS